jgi:predicted molibdopterin-dependent oxidoreductase YjgC
MDEIARLTPTFAGISYDKLERAGSLQWPCNDEAPDGTPTMHVDGFVRGKGRFLITQYVPTDEKVTRRFPLLLDHRPRTFAIQRRRADPPYRQHRLLRRRPAGDPSA